jgi:hypothetical protein
MAEYCNDGRFKIRRYEWLSEQQYRKTPPRSYYWGGTIDSDDIWTRIRTQYACGVLTGSYNHSLSLGYSSSEIIASVPKDASATQIDSIVSGAASVGITKFYMDEPCHNYNTVLCYYNNYLPNLWYLAIKANERNSIVLTSESDGYGEWINCSNVKRLAEAVKNSGHQNIYVGCHTYFGQGGGADPRTQWTWLRNNLGNSFNFAWIRLRQTIDEINLLFGHADNLGGIDPLLFGIWPEEPGWQGTESAVQQGMQHTPGHGTQRLQKRYEFVYCCTTPTYDPDACELESSTPTGEERWVP